MKHHRGPAILIAGLLILAAVSPWLVPGEGTLAQSLTSLDLTTAVQLAGSETPGLPDTSLIVQTVAEQGDWAYGTATAPVTGEHGAPVTRFFLGHMTGDGWLIAFRYTDAFPALLAQAPPSFPTPTIRAMLDGFATAGDGSSQLSFPFPVGQTWSFLGPHPPLGAEIRNGLDFSPFSGPAFNAPVLAMRGGIAYRPCENMVVIDHGDGWQTGYYHMVNITIANGASVTRGQRIGGTSAEINCGGMASSDHVHVWISWQGGSTTPIAGHDIGGWTVEAGEVAYDGCLVRGEIRRCTSENTNFIINDGEIGSSTGSPLAGIDTNVGVVGDQLSYTLDAFPPNQAVTVTWRRPGGSTVPLGSVTTNAAGDATGSFTIPATTGGTANTVHFNAGDLTRSINVRVLPSLRVSPAAAGPGDIITITVTGFSKQSAVRLTFAPEDGQTPVPISTVTANNTGGATATFPVPNDAPTGSVVIQAAVGASFEEYAYGYLFVAREPTLTIVTPGTLQPGRAVTYETYLFPASTAFTLELSPENGGAAVATFPEVITNANGHVVAEFTTPDVPHGRYTLRATAGGTALSATTVTVYPILRVPAGPHERGSTVEVTGVGFTPGSQVAFEWIREASPVDLGAAPADSTGTARITVVVPAAPDGWITLHGFDGDADGYAGLAVLGGPEPGPAAASISPTRSTVNNWVTYDLTNFPANSQVEITWRRTSGGTLVIGTASTDGLGRASGRVRVPATTGGAAQSIRFSSGDVTVTSPFEVVPRIKVTLSPAARGTTVDISLRGYGKQEVVRIRWKQGTSWVELARVTTSNTGSANVKVTVPAWATDGTNSVRGDGTLFRAQTNAVQISGGTFTPASTSQTATPSPTVSPETSPTASVTATPSPTGTTEPTTTATATEPAEPSPTESMTPAPTETATVVPTEEPSGEPTVSVTETPSVEPSAETSP